MAKATLNKSGIATKAGDVTVFNYDGETREFCRLPPSFWRWAWGFQPTPVSMHR